MELGQKVKFNKYLNKRNCVNTKYDDWDKRRNYKKWDTESLDEEKEGIICGKRTINYRGYTEIGHYECPSEFKPLETKQVYLVACDMRRLYRVPKEWLEVGNENSVNS